MALPKIKHTIFKEKLPSDGSEAQFRSFTGKEEKMLLTAQESKDIDQILLTTSQVVNNCLVNKRVEDLPLFDLEYLLVKIRAVSINNIVEFSIRDPEGGEDDSPIPVELDLNEVKVIEHDGHTNIIKIDDNIDIAMRYPSWDEFTAYLKAVTEKNREKLGDIMLGCIDKVYVEDTVTVMKDTPEEEVEEFLNDLTSKNIQDIKNFFDTIPTLRHEVKFKNKKGEDKTFVMEGMETFFI